MFCLIYYLFFTILSLYVNNFISYFIYLAINLLITLPPIINLILFLSIGLGFTFEGIYNDKNPKLDVHKIKCPNLNTRKYTIAHFSDMHLGACYGKKDVEKWINLLYIYPEKIDLLVITGDIVDGNIQMTKEMLEPFKKAPCPIYYSSGNHEGYTWEENVYNVIENYSNIKHLKNEMITIDDKINLIGIDYRFNRTQIRNNLDSLLRNNMRNDYPNVFIYHAPIFSLDELEKYNIFLLLCGHMHGGQFFPGNLLRYLLCGRIFEGLYTYNNRRFAYCSSGLGTSGPTARTFVKAHLGIIVIER